MKLQDLPIKERPRERGMLYGLQALSLRELLCIVISQGSKEAPVSDIVDELLLRYKTVQDLDRATVQELCRVRGLGKAKAVQLQTALELGKRWGAEVIDTPTHLIHDSSDAYDLARRYLKGKKKEHLLLFTLNARYGIIGKPEVLSIGTLDSSLIHQREVFSYALSVHASRIIIAHNHPSGSNIPSIQDLEATSAIVKAGEVMGIPLLDHIVVSDNGYSSIRETNPELFVLN